MAGMNRPCRLYSLEGTKGEEGKRTMSQMPPPPYPPQGPGYPPPGVGYAGPQAMQPRGSNAWGIVSLITSLLGCIPFVGALAVLFGIIGIAKGRKVRAGVGLPVAGLVLGL